MILIIPVIRPKGGASGGSSSLQWNGVDLTWNGATLTWTAS